MIALLVLAFVILWLIGAIVIVSLSWGDLKKGRY